MDVTQSVNTAGKKKGKIKRIVQEEKEHKMYGVGSKRKLRSWSILERNRGVFRKWESCQQTAKLGSGNGDWVEKVGGKWE